MKLTLLALCLLFGSEAYSQQMPVPLLDESAQKTSVANKLSWLSAANIFTAALECKTILNPKDKRIAPYLKEIQEDTWELANLPDSIKVFNIPVTSAGFYIDHSGELGASYTAVINLDQPTVNKEAQIVKGNEKKTKIGNVRTENQAKETLLICTVQGTQTE